VHFSAVRSVSTSEIEPRLPSRTLRRDRADSQVYSVIFLARDTFNGARPYKKRDETRYICNNNIITCRRTSRLVALYELYLLKLFFLLQANLIIRSS